MKKRIIILWHTTLGYMILHATT